MARVTRGCGGVWRARQIVQVAAGVGAVVAAACSKPSPAGRGAGLPLATLDPAVQAQAYTTAVRSEFDLGPDLVLLLDPTYLPSAHDNGSPAPIPPVLVRALRNTGAIQGTCDPQRATRRRSVPAPICRSDRPGYVVHVSEPFQLAADSVQLFVRFERYRATADTMANLGPLEIEHRYVLVPRPGGWRVAHKARRMQG